MRDNNRTNNFRDYKRDEMSRGASECELRLTTTLLTDDVDWSDNRLVTYL